MPSIFLHPAILTFAGVIAAIVILYFLTFGYYDIRDGNIDTLVAISGLAFMVGILIALITYQFIAIGIGLLEPTILFIAISMIDATWRRIFGKTKRYEENEKSESSH